MSGPIWLWQDPIQSLGPVTGRVTYSGSTAGAYDDHCPCCPHRHPEAPVTPWPTPSRDCTLLKPLLMVIPPEGCYISCPEHGSHFVRGLSVTWCAS